MASKLEAKQAEMRERTKEITPAHSLRLLHNSFVGRSKMRGLEWTLTLGQFSKLISSPCAYGLGMRPAIRIGLDRLDNTKGYSLENVVPCCSRHNQIRSNVFTYEDMKTIVRMFSGARDCGNTQGGRGRTHVLRGLCGHGHVLSEDNVYRCKTGRIICATCSRSRLEAWKDARLHALERTD